MTKFRGGGEIGHIRSSWPFVTLEVNESEIRLNIVIKEVAIQRDNVIRIELKSGLLASKVMIKHGNPTIEENVQFWTFSPESVMREIRAKGYPTTYGRKLPPWWI